MLSKANEQKKKKTICQIFHQKKIWKVLMKIEEMADIFLNSANFASHAFLTSAPPSGYALNLKILIKVSKVSWTSQLSYELLRSSFERKSDKTNFVSPKKTPPKSPQFLGLKHGDVGGRGVQKSQKCDDVIYEWSLCAYCSTQSY